MNECTEYQKRAFPMDMMSYRLATQLFKVYNGFIINNDWIDMNVQQNFNTRKGNVLITDNSSLRVGKNILNNKIP